MAEPLGIWFLPDPMGEGTMIYDAHPADRCEGSFCPLHNPSLHWAADFPMRWTRQSGVGSGRMERLCPHGEWHDDPDDAMYRMEAAFKRGERPAHRASQCECECLCECLIEIPF